MLLPLHVHRGDVEGHTFQPQHHKQTLRKRTVANALTVTPSLAKQKTRIFLNIISSFRFFTLTWVQADVSTMLLKDCFNYGK